MTATLTDFLLARIAEDEGLAKATGADAMAGFPWANLTPSVYAEFQARTLHRSRRVLAECEAKRRIVEGEPLRLAVDRHSQWERTLRDLAAVYADHPDYREEWRP